MAANASRQRQEHVGPDHGIDREHVSRCTLLPDRIALLEEMGQGGKVAEIGVAFGDFSRLIWDMCRPVRLHLIDAWQDDRFSEGRARVEERFAAPIRAGRVILHQGHSTECLAALPDQSLDWAYIDTDHSEKLTRRELEISAKKVQRGGRIAGHDFCIGNVDKQIRYGVIPACHDFCSENGWAYEFLTLEPGGHFSFCLKRVDEF